MDDGDNGNTGGDNSIHFLRSAFSDSGTYVVQFRVGRIIIYLLTDAASAIFADCCIDYYLKTWSNMIVRKVCLLRKRVQYK